MKKRKTKTTRSPKQQWHSEREWTVQGVLRSCETKIKNLARLDSTLPVEKRDLLLLAISIDNTRRQMENSPEESFNLWKQRKGL
jgi:hypothetical protein